MFFYFYVVWFKENHLSKINGDLTLTSKKQKVVGHSRGLHPSQECLYLNMMQIFYVSCYTMRRGETLHLYRPLEVTCYIRIFNPPKWDKLGRTIICTTQLAMTTTLR